MRAESTESGQRAATSSAVGLLRWIARLWAAFLVLAWLAFVIGEAHGNLIKVFLSEPLLTALLSLVILGLVAGWRHEVLGGLLILTGIAGFGLADGRVPAWPFLLPGLSAAGYLICGIAGWKTR